MKKSKIIGGLTMLSITGFILKILSEYNILFKNKLALLQFSNSNADYILYKVFNDNYSIISLIVLFLGLSFTYLIMRNKKKKGEIE